MRSWSVCWCARACHSWEGTEEDRALLAKDKDGPSALKIPIHLSFAIAHMQRHGDPNSKGSLTCFALGGDKESKNSEYHILYFQMLRGLHMKAWLFVPFSSMVIDWKPDDGNNSSLLNERLMWYAYIEISMHTLEKVKPHLDVSASSGLTPTFSKARSRTTAFLPGTKKKEHTSSWTCRLSSVLQKEASVLLGWAEKTTHQELFRCSRPCSFRNSRPCVFQCLNCKVIVG